MNDFQECKNTADLLPLYLPQQLFLKPISRINISLQLPNVKKLGKSISHWEIMEKLRELIKPEEFTSLKVVKTTVEFVRFESEVETKAKIEHVLSKLDNRMVKLKDFTDLMRVKAAKMKTSSVVRKDWDEYFHNERLVNPKNPGKPDTIHLSKLPTKWFIPYHLSSDDDSTPSEKLLYRIFEKFGRIKNVDIPICDPYRNQMKDHISGIQTSSYDKMDFFEGYVQFKDYMGFVKAMETLSDVKLVHKSDQGAVEANIIVDYDRTKHLSDGSIRRREIVRERLIKKAKEKEEKEQQELEDRKNQEQIQRQKALDQKVEKERRRRLREEKRKIKVLEKLKISGSDEINDKIAREEKKLLKVQRRLEAIRLVEELFKRIKEKRQDGDRTNKNSNNEELMLLKNTSELAVLTQREKLHNAIKGRVMLKSMLADGKQSESSSESSLSLDEEASTERKSQPINSIPPLYDNQWFGFPYPMYPPPGLYHPHLERMGFPGTSRGGFNRRNRGGRGFRGNYRGRNNRYSSDAERDYQRPYSKFMNDHDNRYHRRRRTRSRSRSRSYRSRSSDRSRSRSRSYSRSRSRSKSRSKHDKSKRRSDSRHSSSRSRSNSRRRSSTRSNRKSSRSRSEGKEYEGKKKSRHKTRSRSKDLVKDKGKSRSRSRSWSLPKDGKESRSWSKTPEK